MTIIQWFKFIFNGANLFLILVLFFTVVNSFLEYKIYQQSLPVEIVENSQITPLSKSYSNFGGVEYLISYQGKIYKTYYYQHLDVGAKYLADFTVHPYDTSQETNSFQKNSLSIGVKGQIKDLVIKQKNQAKDWQYLILNSVEKTRLHLSDSFYEFYCIDNKYIANLFQVKCQDIYGLSFGLVLGGTDKFSEEIKNNFKDLGLFHLVAVSGFQVILIVSFLEIILLRLKIRPRYQFLLALLSLLFFILLVGPQPPILRSFLSIFLSLGILVFLGRRLATFRALIYSAIVLLWFNPLYLFSISFQLSFLATIGVILAGFNYSETSWEIWKRFKTLVLSSLYAFLYTLPIIMIIAGKVIFLAVITNILILPFIPLITILNILGMLPILGGVFLLISGILQAGILAFVTIFSNTSWNQNLTMFSESFSVFEIIFYYFLLTGIILSYNFYSKKKLAENKNFT